MRVEIKRLHQKIATTMIYVTHDQIEAMTLADWIVLMRDGVIEQQGAPLDLFERPATRFVAGFLGSPRMNFVPCKLARNGAGASVTFEDGRRLPLPAERASLPAGDLIFGVRPEHMSRATPGAALRPGQAAMTVTIDLVQPTGTRTFAQFKLGGVEATVELPSHAVDKPGASVELLVDMSRAIFVDPKTDKVLHGPN
jgi:multiple sugar transport system ATP-binding protein